MKTPVTQRSPCNSAESALLMNPLPDRLIIRHFATPTTSLRINTSYYSLFGPDPLPSRELESNTSKFNVAELYCRIKSGTRCLEEAEQQAEASVDVPYPPLQIVNSAPFCLFSLLSILLLPHPFFLLFHQCYIFTRARKRAG